MKEKRIMEVEDLTFDKLKDGIIYVLTRKNEELANYVPHVDYLDLMIVFYWRKSVSEYCPINNGIAETMDVDADDLMLAAMENTSRLMGYTVKGILSVIADCCGYEMFDFKAIDEEIPMYIASNNIFYNGACVMLYNGFMRALAKKLGSNLFIIPSSVHEIIVLRDLGNGELETDRLKEMISYVNQTEVRPEDKLSDSLYYYDRETDKITIVE